MTHFDGCDQQPFGHLTEGSAFVDNVPAPPEVIQGLESMSVNELNHYFKNPREGDVEAIAESLRINGQYRPIVVNLGRHTGRPLEVLAGNHTLKAARKLGWDSIKVTTIDVDDLAAARIVAADNRTADLGGYNEATLAELLQGIGDLAGTGYGDDDLGALLDELGTREEGLTDPDDAPPPPADPVARAGDVWLLGAHRLACGDGTEPETVVKATGGREVDLYLTDPPYNVDYDANDKTGGDAGKVNQTRAAHTIENDKMGDAAFRDFLVALFSAAEGVARPGAPFYVFHESTRAGIFQGAVREAGWDFKQLLVWVKNRMVMGRQDHHWQHELVLYGWKPGAAHSWYGGRSLTTLLSDDEPPLKKLTKDELLDILTEALEHTDVLRFDNDLSSPYHPTQKPTKMLESLIERSSKRGDLVLDTCGGGGSTLIAAHRTGRVAATVELDPAFVDATCRRFQEHTGILPIHEASGEPYDFVGGADAS